MPGFGGLLCFHLQEEDCVTYFTRPLSLCTYVDQKLRNEILVGGKH